MKRFLLYTILFLLCRIGYGQVTVIIELTVEGQSIGANGDAFEPEDLEWTVTNLNTGCVVDQEEAYRKFTIVKGGVNLGGITVLMIDMNVFDDCAAAAEGHKLIFDMKVVNSASKFYGYTAKKSFIVPGGSIGGVLSGENAINFTRGSN